MFKRKIEEKLYEYYKNPESPIMIITGARQIGKSFIIRETAKRSFSNYIEIDLKEDSEGDKKFKGITTINSFYLQLGALYGDKLGSLNDTIIFLDEIQTYPELITLLKYLKQDNRFRFICSGSLLGITLKHVFIPMGYIEEVKMYPMDFEEFLYAYHTNYTVIDYLRKCFLNHERVDDNIHKTILRKFKEYLITGGLPQAVKEYIENINVYKTRTIQEQIHDYYKDDASKYDTEKKLKVRTIYDILPSYMENKVKRITFKEIENKVNANLMKYQDEFDYLISSGCALSVKAVSNLKFPLIESNSKNLIKLYLNDVGILSNILYKTNINAVLNGDEAINLGSVYETACAMELKAHGHDVYYFDSKKVGEVDFLINDYDSLSIVPIEIKSGKHQNNFRAIPKLLKEPYNLKKGYVFGNDNNIHEKDGLWIMPIYMIMFV